MKILAVSQAGEGQQTDQTVTTPGCLCEYSYPFFTSNVILKRMSFRILLIYTLCLCLTAARDHLAASPPPPDHVTVLASNSSTVTLRWSPPALPSRKHVRYTVRCTPVGTPSATAVRYLQV